MDITVNSANNRVNGWTYDPNGNTTGKPEFSGSYDVENRLQWGSGPGGEEYYGYGADNRRVYQSKLTNAGTGATQELVTFWSGGKRAGRYELAWSGATFAFKTLETNVYFGGKPLRLGTQTNVVTDRLGSVRREAKDFFPYGQERTVTAGETEKYATYMHDGRTDLAYADQRYYATGAGRFMTADPAGDGLNWYAYTGGDPVNNSDPTGLAGCRAVESTAIDPAGQCPKGFFWYATADPFIFRPPNSGDVYDNRELAPGVAWATAMLFFGDADKNKYGPECEALFTGREEGPYEWKGITYHVPKGGYRPWHLWYDWFSNSAATGRPDYYLRSSVVVDVPGGSSALTQSLGGNVDVLFSEGTFGPSATMDAFEWLDKQLQLTKNLPQGYSPQAALYIYQGLGYIHEFGHVWNNLGQGLFGSSAILDNDKDDFRQSTNNKKVFNSCVAPFLGIDQR